MNDTSAYSFLCEKRTSITLRQAQGDNQIDCVRNNVTRSTAYSMLVALSLSKCYQECLLYDWF